MMTNDDGLEENISMQAISDNAINTTSDWEIIYLNLDKNICMLENLRRLKTDFQVFENIQLCSDYIFSVRDHTIILVVTGQHLATNNLTWLNIYLCSTVIFIYVLITKNILFRSIDKRQQSIFYIAPVSILKNHLEKLSSTEIFIYDQNDYLHLSSKKWHVFQKFDLYLDTILQTSHEQSITLVLVLQEGYHELYDYLHKDPTILSMNNISSILVTLSLYEEQSYVSLTSLKKYLFRQIKMCVDEESVIAQYLNDTLKIVHHQTMNKDDQQISLCNIRRRRFQLLVDYLVAMPRTPQSLQELINECRYRYANNSQEQLKINEFEEQNCGANNAIKWYTRDSFVYRLLNEACRSESINLIYAFRSFISDLYNQLKSLPRPTGEFHVYRGQLMLSNELEILKSNLDQCFFTNTFLSTTFYYNVALVFSGCDQKTPDRESVIFDFKLDTCQRSKPFADISEYSYLQDEREVLISMGTMFRLDSIEFNEILSVWYAELSLCEYNVTMNDYCSLFRRDPKTTHVLLLPGGYLEDLEAFNDAEYFYRLYLEDEDASMNKTDFSLAHTGIARVCQSKGEYAAAIENLDVAWNYCAKDDHVLYLKILLLKGEVFKTSNCRNDALDIFKQINENLTISDCEHAQVLNEIGEIHLTLKNYSDAIDSFQKALDYLHTVNYLSEKRLRSRITGGLKLAQFGMKVQKIGCRSVKKLSFIDFFCELMRQNIRSLLIIFPIYFLIYSMDYDGFIFNVISYWNFFHMGRYFAPTINRWFDTFTYRFRHQYRHILQLCLTRFIFGMKICETIVFLYGLFFIMTDIHWLTRLIIMLGCLYYSILLRPCFVFLSMQFLFQQHPGLISFIVGYLFIISDALIRSMFQLDSLSRTEPF